MEVIWFIISIKKAVKWNLIEDDAATIQFRAPSAFAQSNSKATIQFNEPEKNAQMFEFRRFRLVKILQRRVCVRGGKRESLWTSPTLIWNYPECNNSLVICQENYIKQVSVYWPKTDSLRALLAEERVCYVFCHSFVENLGEHYWKWAPKIVT